MAIEKEAPEEMGAVIRYNLSESAVADRTLADLGISIPADLVLTYTEHQGSSQIRRSVAEACGLTPDDILVTAGASTALFIVATTILGPDDHLVVTRPNYATSLETPRAIGCSISYIDLEFEKDFRLDLDQLAAAIKPSTKLISVCSPNNPAGTMLDASELKALADLAQSRGCYLLVDETYADLIHSENPPPAAASLGDHVIGTSSMSKAYGVPGIRIGWLSTKNPILQESFLAAKEQISISGSVLDELVAEKILSRRTELLSATKKDMLARLSHLQAWAKKEEEHVEFVSPSAGVMVFVHIKREPAGGIEAFYKRLIEHGAYVGPGRWFERPDSFFRLGYAWPTMEDLDAGLQAISKALRGE
ncbi:Pyridoxal phosphate-dependent transferase, major protein [Arthroderma uncinatum]|uniref:Pyridoxal phosphate-dependent transferase, major protein n=1 Tax=Arthroderma uncinatum TaxID=74035 RepID=UPI00144AFA72|nr:Pyridoxal phosphate-dependent transferase, major protein [Arthroderma uncinatum]KAF3481807.1 Pyridoxal phosphate-dependent transferase, major protein [Arthroderma uncinatum]